MEIKLKRKYRVYSDTPQARRSARGGGNQGKSRTKVPIKGQAPPRHRTLTFSYLPGTLKLRRGWK